jgi:hypothetical protein
MHAKSFSRGGTQSPRLKPAAIQWVLVFIFAVYLLSFMLFAQLHHDLFSLECLARMKSKAGRLVGDLYVTIVKKKWIFLLDKMATVGNSGLSEKTFVVKTVQGALWILQMTNDLIGTDKTDCRRERR